MSDQMFFEVPIAWCIVHQNQARHPEYCESALGLRPSNPDLAACDLHTLGFVRPDGPSYQALWQLATNVAYMYKDDEIVVGVGGLEPFTYAWEGDEAFDSLHKIIDAAREVVSFDGYPTEE